MTTAVPALPSPLSPWRPWLAPLAAEVRDWLGGALLKLRPLLPAPGTNVERSQGEFAGYRGISRRGLPERLLASEWLYALELPDEFLRRYGSGESLHLEPLRQDQAAERLQLVLFDSGPAQLGACRLAHLALWVLLAQQAAAHKQRFAFGSLQSSLAAVCEQTDAEGWRHLLALRSPDSAQDAALTRWSARLSELKPAVLWLIGAPDTPAPKLPPGTRLERLQVDEPPRLAERVLKLANLRSTITLALPPERLAARLLRDPLASHPAAARPAAPSALWSELPDLPLRHRVQFSGDGRRLLVRLADDRSVLQVVPNAPRAPLPEAKVVATTNRTLAVRINKRSVSELRRREDGQWLLVHGLGLPEAPVRLGEHSVGLAVGDRRRQLWRCRDSLLLLDTHKVLHRFVLATGGGVAQQVVARNVLCLEVREADGQYRYISADETWRTQLHRFDGQREHIEPLESSRQALLDEFIFLNTAPDHWWAGRPGEGGYTFWLNPDEQVIGSHRRGLVTTVPGRPGVNVHAGSKPDWVALPDEPLSPSLSVLGVLAWFTRDRELVLYSLDRQCELRRFRGGK